MREQKGMIFNISKNEVKNTLRNMYIIKKVTINKYMNSAYIT